MSSTFLTSSMARSNRHFSESECLKTILNLFNCTVFYASGQVAYSAESVELDSAAEDSSVELASEELDELDEAFEDDEDDELVAYCERMLAKLRSLIFTLALSSALPITWFWKFVSFWYLAIMIFFKRFL